MGLRYKIRQAKEARLKRRTLDRWRADPQMSSRVERVLSLDPSELGLSAGVADPRSLPGNPEFQRSGWYEHMLLRYFLAMEAARGRRVLDSCCGLGWGSHLIASVASEVVGIDLDPEAVEFCQRTWGDENASYVTGSVLELPFANDEFDVVLCMEAIEHFSRSDGRRYLQELFRVCRPGGRIFGSSGFTENRQQAEELCAKNEHHLFIYTLAEMERLLGELFSAPTRLTHHYFAATKPS